MTGGINTPLNEQKTVDLSDELMDLRTYRVDHHRRDYFSCWVESI